jgi:hypothetical protein
MDPDRFAAEQTFAEFVESATEYKELWTIGAKRAEVPAGVVEELASLNQPLRFAVLNEDWCLDAVGTVPYVAKLADILPDVDVRIFGRDANPDLMDSHLTNGGRSIPAVIAYDGEWNEIGWWGPRPAPLQAWVLEVGKHLPKDEKYRHTRQWYARDKGETTLREIIEILRPVLDSAATPG